MPKHAVGFVSRFERSSVGNEVEIFLIAHISPLLSASLVSADLTFLASCFASRFRVWDRSLIFVLWLGLLACAATMIVARWTSSSGIFAYFLSKTFFFNSSAVWDITTDLKFWFLFPSRSPCPLYVLSWKLLECFTHCFRNQPGTQESKKHEASKDLHEMIDPSIRLTAFVLEGREDELSHDSSKLSTCCRHAMCGWPISGRKYLARDNKLQISRPIKRMIIQSWCSLQSSWRIGTKQTA